MKTKNIKKKNFFSWIRKVIATSFLCLIFTFANQPVWSQMQQYCMIVQSVDNPENKTISSFSMLEYSGKIYLKWIVQCQRQNCIFLIERSIDGRNFELLTIKDGYGISVDVPIMYSFVDSLPIQMTTYYKIYVIDRVGNNKIEPEMLQAEKP